MKHRLAPVLTLLLLAPIVGEVLSGATRLSYIIVLIPEIMVWGCGALLIREAVRRWRGGWISMLVLGLALAVAEELVIQQTSLAPLPWLGDLPAYGRVWGVNWVYFLFMLGYEATWIVLVPVQLTELLFPDRRDQPWLRATGLVVASIVFALGSFIAWFLWTQRARPVVFHVPIYHPPIAAIVIGLLAIVALAAAAFALRSAKASSKASSTNARQAPPAWQVGLGAVLLGLPWYALMTVVFAPRPELPLAVPMLGGCAWAILASSAVRRWAGGAGWSDHHRWALVFGALLVSMSAGFLGSETWPQTDVVAKAALNVLAVLALLLLARRIHQRGPAT